LKQVEAGEAAQAGFRGSGKAATIPSCGSEASTPKGHSGKGNGKSEEDSKEQLEQGKREQRGMGWIGCHLNRMKNILYGSLCMVIPYRVFRQSPSATTWCESDIHRRGRLWAFAFASLLPYRKVLLPSLLAARFPSFITPSIHFNLLYLRYRGVCGSDRLSFTVNKHA
jgi:hypothetical protein